jgi:alginate O-acetyltransferase complex protein AlgI
MLFNSYTFVLFFVLVLIVHSAPIEWKYKKINLLVSSYIFYAAWNPLFLPLIIFSTVLDWWLAKAIFQSKSKKKKKHYLVASLISNLSLLSYFKYSQFLSDSLSDLLQFFGYQFTSPEFDIVLPLGISFYTFQTLSYSMDVYRGEIKPWKSFLDYALYVTFFPQLVAGPIVRAKYFLPQCLAQRDVGIRHKYWGLNLVILGAFQKLVLADTIFAPVSDKVFSIGDREIISGFDSLIGTLAFSGQIFCDFAGYSTIAIGLALILGFKLPDNFRFPYAARGFSDFWKRWHISLSTWLRDYLYIPLGGNHKGIFTTLRNLMATMFLGGLWHGANWTFVIWGVLHGLFLVIEHIGRISCKALNIQMTMRSEFFMTLLTFIFVSYAWIFFRAESLADAIIIHNSLFDFESYDMNSVLNLADSVLVLVCVSLLLLSHYLLRDKSLEQVAERVKWWMQSSVLTGMLFLIFTSSTNNQSFIYFQF